MIDPTKPANEHKTIDCSGVRTNGMRCRKWQWFHRDALPERWYCNYHGGKR